MEIEKEYIDWLQANYPDADHTKDLTRDYRAQESRKKVYSMLRSEHTAIARGSEDSYDDWNNNQSWSEFSRLVRE